MISGTLAPECCASGPFDELAAMDCDCLYFSLSWYALIIPRRRHGIEDGQFAAMWTIRFGV